MDGRPGPRRPAPFQNFRDSRVLGFAEPRSAGPGLGRPGKGSAELRLAGPFRRASCFDARARVGRPGFGEPVPSQKFPGSLGLGTGPAVPGPGAKKKLFPSARARGGQLFLIPGPAAPFFGEFFQVARIHNVDKWQTAWPVASFCSIAKKIPFSISKRETGGEVRRALPERKRTTPGEKTVVSFRAKFCLFSYIAYRCAMKSR